MTDAAHSGQRGASGAWGAIILAAGASTRMGTNKQLLMVDGRPLVVRAVEAALEGGLWPVIVVLGANAAEIRPVLARHTVLPVENAAWPEGMASSVRAGIGALRQFSRDMDGVLLAVCDQPGFTPEVVRRLRAARETSGRSMAAASYAGQVGVPALFSQQHFPALAALTGEQGARVLLQQGGDDVAAVDMPPLALDLDTPEDVRRLRGEARGGV
jgi:molybdenum cofactor cytidylyltransferase